MQIWKKILKLWYRLTYRFKRPKIDVPNASFSGDGSFIDVRFWLSRPDKIKVGSRPYLITAEDKKLYVMQIAKLGAMQTRLKKHTNNGMLLFYNKNNAVKPGEKVTLCWDDLKVEDIVIK